MIAICPSCHDEVHHGRLKISDETLYQWKEIVRPERPEAFQLHVEPAPTIKMMLGTICFSTKNDRAVIFELSNRNRLSFRILDGDLMRANVLIEKLSGEEVLHVVDNVVRVPPHKDVTFEARAGKVRVTVPATAEYIPPRAIAHMRIQEPLYGAAGRLTALDLEVLKPGLLRVEGFWPSPNGVVVITRERLSFCRPDLLQPLSMVGAGEETVYMFTGPVTTALFT
jgi:hypothetical protein